MSEDNRVKLRCQACGDAENLEAKRIAELEVVIQCEDCSAKTTISNKCGLSTQVLTGCKAKERIEELETGIKDVCDLINKKTTVSKWQISNQLDRTLKG